MPKTFTITTTATDTIKTDAKGHAEAVFTVTNTSSRPVRGMAKATPLDSTRQEWLKITGETDRDFSPGGTQQFVVTFDGPVADAPPASSPKPGGAPARTGPTAADKNGFRLDVALATNPDEDFTEGPAVNVELPKPAAKPAAAPFPKWLIFVIIGVVLLVGVLIVVLVVKSGKKNQEEEPEETPTPASSPTPKAAATFDGNWVNADKNTKGVTRLEIQQTGTQLSVHAFGSCTPKDCDWGTEKGTLVGDTAHVTWNPGFATQKMNLTLKGDKGLKLVLDTDFTDKNRLDLHEEDDFVRGRPKIVIKPRTDLVTQP